MDLKETEYLFSLQVVPSLAKVLLHTHEWAVGRVISQFRSNSSQLLISSCVKPAIPPVQHQENLTYMTCPVCIATHPREKFCSLACGHMFCKDCWAMHFEVQISLGVSTGKSKSSCTHSYLLIPFTLSIHLNNPP